MTLRPAGPHAVIFVLVTVLVDTVGFGMILPVMPELIIELTGESLNRAAVYGGWLAFVYAVLQFVCAPVLGNLSDRFGRRPVLLFAVAALGIDYIIMGLAPSLAWLFAGRTIAGIAAAALSLLNFTYGVFVLPESLAPDRRRAFDWRRANPLGTLLQLRNYPVVLGLLVALFLWQLAHQVLPSTWAYYTMFKFGWSGALVGASLAFVGAIMAVSQATLPRWLIPRLGEATCATVGLVFGGLGFLGYGLATRGWMMFALLLTWFFGALVMPSTNALMSHRVPASAQGELQGGVASLYSLSSIVGPPLMTQLFGYFSAPTSPVPIPGAAFFFAAALTVGSLFFFRRALRADERRGL